MQKGKVVSAAADPGLIANKVSKAHFFEASKNGHKDEQSL